MCQQQTGATSKLYLLFSISSSLRTSELIAEREVTKSLVPSLEIEVVIDGVYGIVTSKLQCFSFKLNGNFCDTTTSFDETESLTSFSVTLFLTSLASSSPSELLMRFQV